MRGKVVGIVVSALGAVLLGSVPAPVSVVSADGAGAEAVTAVCSGLRQTYVSVDVEAMVDFVPGVDNQCYKAASVSIDGLGVEYSIGTGATISVAAGTADGESCDSLNAGAILVRSQFDGNPQKLMGAGNVDVGYVALTAVNTYGTLHDCTPVGVVSELVFVTFTCGGSIRARATSGTTDVIFDASTSVCVPIGDPNPPLDCDNVPADQSCWYDQHCVVGGPCAELSSAFLGGGWCEDDPPNEYLQQECDLHDNTGYVIGVNCTGEGSGGVGMKHLTGCAGDDSDTVIAAHQRNTALWAANPPTCWHYSIEVLDESGHDPAVARNRYCMLQGATARTIIIPV